MAPVVALFVIASVSLVIVRLGALALARTGMSRTAADFQATSAFFGVGFTTSEAELVVRHRVRRRIVRDLIIAGNIGLTSALAALVVTFIDRGPPDETPAWAGRLGVIVGGLLVLLLLASYSPARRLLDSAIAWTLRLGGLDRPRDFEMIMRLADGYAIGEVDLPEGHWLVGASLAESRLGSMGVLVLGVERDRLGAGAYVGTPHGDTRPAAGDRLIVYGRERAVRDLGEADRLTFQRRHAKSHAGPGADAGGGSAG